MPILKVQNLIERISNLVRTEVRNHSNGHPLLPVHLDALQYLSHCNRYSDTPLGVADYLGLTKGTTSQTLRVLERRGLLSRNKDARDGRVVHLKLTDQGHALLDSMVPSPILRQAKGLVSPADLSELEAVLSRLLQACQKANRMKSFGVCKSCRHNRKTETAYFCELTQEPLSPQDIELICREHEASTGNPS